MSALASFPFFSLLLVWLSGTLLGLTYPIARIKNLLIWAIILCSLLYVCLLIIQEKYGIAHRCWLGFLAFVLLLLMSYGNVWLDVAYLKRTHFTTWIKHNHTQEPYNKPIIYCVTIDKVYQTKNPCTACRVSVTHIESNKSWYVTTGTLCIYFSKKLPYQPKQGDLLLIRGSPTIRQPNTYNPAKQLHHNNTAQYRDTVNCALDFILITPESLHWKIGVQQWLIQKMGKHLKNQSSIAFMQALFFGDKKAMHPVLTKTYSDTGSIHILSVSGLHVNMIYWIMHTTLRSILCPVGLLKLPLLASLCLLWLYAALCGYAAPIFRATVMASFSKLGLLMGKEIITYNLLFLSAFILLVWKPSLVSHCNVQLSYMATLGILYLHPKLYHSLTINNYAMRKLWEITSISVSTQIATFPLILYYFKQFPVYFIIANWIVVPAIFSILMVSFCLMIANPIPIIGHTIGYILDHLIFATNGFIAWITTWPLNKIENLSIDCFYCCLCYMVMVATLLFLQYKNLTYLCITTTCISLYTIHEIVSLSATQKICTVIFDNKASVERTHRFHFILQDRSTYISSETCLQEKLSYMQPFSGGIAASWHGKSIFSIERIPYDWYGWHNPKIDADYMLIDEKLLDEICVLNHVFNLHTVVVYAQEEQNAYKRWRKKVASLHIQLIWVKVDEQKKINGIDVNTERLQKSSHKTK